jgi:protein TonB
MVSAPAPDQLATLPAMTVRAPDPGRVESPPAETAKRPAPRPEPRPEPARIEAEPERDPEETPRKAARATPHGNADRDARAGQETGREQAKAATSGLGGTTGETGTAAVSNYPGLVMRKLARVPRPRLAARGATVVAFRIADNGRLATASVARSSGAAALDQAALRLVQRAAPFPPPPSGAQRSFSIRIEGR